MTADGLLFCATLNIFCLFVCLATYNSVKSELEHEKVMRLEAETKQKELQATEARHQQKLLDLEAQLRDLEAAKVSDRWLVHTKETFVHLCLLEAYHYSEDRCSEDSYSERLQGHRTACWGMSCLTL